MTGIGIINIFSTAIFENVHKAAVNHKLTLSQENYYIGLSGFSGAVLSLWSIRLLSRRAIFIGGHFVMMILLFLVAYYID